MHLFLWKFSGLHFSSFAGLVGVAIMVHNSACSNIHVTFILRISILLPLNLDFHICLSLNRSNSTHGHLWHFCFLTKQLYLPNMTTTILPSITFILHQFNYDNDASIRSHAHRKDNHTQCRAFWLHWECQVQDSRQGRHSSGPTATHLCWQAAWGWSYSVWLQRSERKHLAFGAEVARWICLNIDWLSLFWLSFCWVFQSRHQSN